MKKHRYTIVDFPKPGDTYGEYLGETPGRAASKAFTQLSRLAGMKNGNAKNFMVFTVRDLDTGKPYKYVGTRVALNEPIVRKINNTTVKYRYRNIITNYEKSGFGNN